MGDPDAFRQKTRHENDKDPDQHYGVVRLVVEPRRFRDVAPVHGHQYTDNGHEARQIQEE